MSGPILHHSERLGGAHSLHRARIMALFGIAKMSLMVVRCYASPSDQQAIWQVGRTWADGVWIRVPGQAVRTDAAPGRSTHELVTPEGRPASCATDLIPVDEYGQPVWNTPTAIWTRLYQAAETAGLDAYGEQWGKYLAYDKGHFEEPGIDELLEAYAVQRPVMSVPSPA